MWPINLDRDGEFHRETRIRVSHLHERVIVKMDASSLHFVQQSLNLPCSKKTQHCDWISGLPDEILAIILNKLDTRTAVSTSLLSRRWRHLWTFLESFHFTEVPLPSNYCWVRLGPMVEEYLNRNKLHHFVQSLQWFTGIKRQTALRRLSLVFSGSSECTDVVNGAIASAIEHGVEDIDVAIVGHAKYEFPSWLFSGDRSSSLAGLCLNYCRLSVPLHFGGFSSLTKLVLVVMHMSLKETQALLMNCTNLQSLHLIGMSDIRTLRLPKLKELIWFWSSPCGTFKIDTPALQRLEYCGEVLPASTFQSLRFLQHVSLQYVCDDPLMLENISTCFPHVRSLHLRYDVPKFVKPRVLAIFSNLKVLTLNITTKPSDDLHWIAMFVVAAPYLVTLQTNVRCLSAFESHKGVVWEDFNFEHTNLKEVEMYNFAGRDNEINFARLLLCRAPNMRRVAFSQAPLQEAVDHQLVPPDWPRAEEFSPRDNQFVLSKLLEGVSSRARVLFM